MNSTLTQYDPSAYSTLPHFEENRRFATEAADTAEALGKIIIRHGMNDFFAVCLLHKHFELSKEELLVETISEAGAIIAPRPRAAAVEVVPYMWRCVTGPDGSMWFPLEFVESASISAELVDFVRTDLTKQSALFSDLAAYLSECDMPHVFGLALIHRHRIVIDGQNQSLLETDAGTGARALSVSAAPRFTTQDSGWTQTLWQFDRYGNPSAGACNGHGCAGHCGSHGTGGQPGGCIHK